MSAISLTLPSMLDGVNVLLSWYDVVFDMEKYFQWMSDPETSRYLEYKPADINDLRMTLEGRRHFHDTEHLIKVYTINAKRQGALMPIGTTAVRINIPNKRASTWRTLIGEKKFRGKGYSREAKILLLRCLFRDIKVEMVGAGVYTENTASIKSLLSLGYRNDGILRQWDYDAETGRRLDVMEFSLLADEFFELEERGYYKL